MGFIDKLKSAAGFGDELAPEVSWENRLLEAAYTPPSGLRITFDYQDLSQTVEKKTSAFEFPDAEGTLVQDHGMAGRRFPWRIFFSGPDCDMQAKVFEAALMERGIGVLETPLYGQYDVIPFGDISRRDDLVTAANQVVFEVTFFSTLGSAYPAVQDDPASAVLTALDLFGDASGAEFASSLDLGSAAEEAGLLDTINGLVADVGDKLDRIAACQAVVKDEFDDIVATINATIDTLVAQPLALAWSTKQMIQAPATALADVTARLDAYSNLAANIFGASDAVSPTGGPGGLGPHIDSKTGVGNDAQEPNKFHARDLFAQLYITGLILSVLYTNTTKGSAGAIPNVSRRRADTNKTNTGRNSFETAPQALAAAEVILAQLDALAAWRDENYESISGGNLSAPAQADFISSPGNTDQGLAFRYLSDAAALAAGFLIDLSFSLAKERKFILDRPRSIIDLTAELYGNVDDNLDFFIDSNHLNGDEIFELPKGRQIVYYV